tara:strand:- start:3296 stop:4225 length:930 start_codon:yes stop_codon:yes gene_type:complete
MFRVFILIIGLSLSHNISICQEKKNIIIDADTANEIDDMFAIVRALIEPSFNVLGITSAHFHTSPYASKNSNLESHKVNLKIIELLNIENIPLFIGSNKPIENSLKPSISEASNFIVKVVNQLSEDEKLIILILGPCTNIASAILQEPSIISKIEVYYIGFWHDPIQNKYSKEEFNTRNDRLALDLLLNTKGLNFNVMSASTSQNLVFKKSNVFDNLKEDDGIGRYLINRWNTYDRWWTKVDPLKNEWIMWDLALIEALIDSNFAKKEQFYTPKENVNRLINIYTYIDVTQMKIDFWKEIRKIIKSDIH